MRPRDASWPRRADFPSLASFAAAFLPHYELVKDGSTPAERYWLLCEFMRHCAAEYPTLGNHGTTSADAFWEAMRNKLRQLASQGVTAVTVWWRADFGATPTINRNGDFASERTPHRNVRKTLRRRRILCLKALMRAGIPDGLRARIVWIAGL